MPELQLRSVVLGAPDPQALGRFYATLLGWDVADDAPDWVRLERPDRGMCLSFQIETEHVPPVWPASGGDQQMQMHLDILVDDLEASVARAVELGAEVVEQSDPGLRVLRDPAGHPFCLFLPGS